MEGHHEMMRTVRQTNQRCLAEIEEFRSRVEKGQATREDHAVIKKKFPYYGFIPCRAAGVDFLILHTHDDVVGWEYLWYGEDGYERPIVQTWVEWAKDSRLVYDVGAYTGLMSILAAVANPSVTVHLFEPIDRTVERASMNLRLNHVHDRVRLHNVAASARAGKVSFNMYRPDSFLGTGNSVYDKGIPIDSVKEVDRVTVDGLLPGLAPDLVKVDVEGHELDVLRGMAGSIEAGRPRMIIEMWEHTRSDVLALLGSWGYECEPFEDEESRVMNFRCEDVSTRDERPGLLSGVSGQGDLSGHSPAGTYGSEAP